jgi:endonuclease/exonuclease/phosphatase (EEP) superfamily protein YafD
VQRSADRLGVRVAIAATRLAALGSLLAVISLVPLHPLSLLEHFRLQLLLGSIGIAAVAAALRQAGWFDLAALCALLNLVLVAPGLSGSRRDGPRNGESVRLLFANVLTSNRNVAALVRAIAELQPEIIALVEADQRWFDALQPSLADYPGRLEIDDIGNFGVALYARGSVRGTVEYLGSRQPTILATVELTAPSRAVPLHVVVTHPVPPASRGDADIQRRHLAAVAAVVRGLPGSVILAGDLNTTPWSRSFATFLRATGLYDSRAGFGAQPSFPTASAILRIPIDHVFLSPQLGVHDRFIGPDIGSDHLPVVVDLVVPRRY